MKFVALTFRTPCALTACSDSCRAVHAGHIRFAITADGRAWVQRRWLSVPTARTLGAMATEPARKKIVLFRGLAATRETLEDTWELSNGIWVYYEPAHHPPPTSNHSMAYEAEPRRDVNASAVWFGVLGSTRPRLRHEKRFTTRRHPPPGTRTQQSPTQELRHKAVSLAVIDSSCQRTASSTLVKRRDAEAGRYLSLRNSDTMYGLSSLTRGMTKLQDTSCERR
jgi:hypothetical protein